MKILDRYIITTYLKSFLSVFIILMMIFVLQTIWLFIKELAGKDLDVVIILKFLLYYSPKLIPLVLPLTILLSSIMVFGNFAENYEFAAMKSTGISLQRAMAGLSVFIVILGIVTFFFSNNVIPWGEYHSYNLRKNIAKLKPAMVIVEGQFNDVATLNIKVEKKTGDKGQYLHDIIIHKKPNTGLGNYTTIVAKEGELVGQENSDILKLILKDGYYYDDTPPKKSKERRRRPFTKSAFDVYTINTDLSQLDNVDLDDKNVDSKYSMLNISGLNYTIDSLAFEREKDYDKLSHNVYNRYSIKNLEISLKPLKDTIYTGNILDLYDNDKQLQIVELSINSSASTKQILHNNERSFKTKSAWLNKHVIALHEKLSLGFACIILFFVGAPLGALIRKGGLGLPMIIAILLFLTYHFIGIFAKNSAKDGTFNPVLATWFSTLIMLPLGVFLTRRATADKGLLEFDHILIPLKKLLHINNNSDEVFADGLNRDFSDFKRYKEDKLLNIIKDPTTYNYHESGKIEALYTLEERNLNLEDLRKKGIHIDENFEISRNLVTRLNIYSKIALIFNSIGIVLLVLFFILRNNKMAAAATTCIQLSIISLVVFIIYYITQQFNLIALKKHLNQKSKKYNTLFIILGFIIYPIAHAFFKYKTKEDLSRNAIQHLN
ncbi:LptF/LptG family permease [Formosa sp. L2A11]|uniref:LptF/LptG family permease n=1 Tax=Formosa sp. L2A11 TaxID=2686363 RepID=UPI00131CA7DF